MAVRIKLIKGCEGISQEQDISFDEHKKEILFGRAHEADIRWKHTEETKHLSARHFSLVQELGRYRIKMQGDNPVFLDGKELHDEEELIPGAHTVAVGYADGPTYQITTTYIDTEVPETEAVFTTRKTARQEARSSATKLSVIVVIVALLGSLGWYITQSEVSELDDIIEQNRLALQETLDAQKQQKSNLSDVLPDLRKSVYLVAGRLDGGLEGIGTAWVVDNGTLATNSHVVEGAYDYIEAGAEIVLVSNQPPFTQIAVSDMVMHPHYDAFQQALSDNPIHSDSGRQVQLIMGYDVALLKVNQTDAGKLAPPLKLATTEEIYALDAADESAYIGYPMENMVGGGVKPDQPNPQVQIGNITSVTDYFLTNKDPMRNHLVQFNMGAHGGASGSPIFNKNGHVVALLSAGNADIIDGRRLASAVNVNFGQRVDVLIELMENRIGEVDLQRREYWKSRTSEYRSLVETIYSGYERDIENEGYDIELLRDETLNLRYLSDINQSGWIASFDVYNKDQLELVVAYAPNGEDINMYLIDSRYQILAESAKSDSFPILVLTEMPSNPKGSPYKIVITGPSAGVEFKLKWGRSK